MPDLQIRFFLSLSVNESTVIDSLFDVEKIYWKIGSDKFVVN